MLAHRAALAVGFVIGISATYYLLIAGTEPLTEFRKRSAQIAQRPTVENLRVLFGPGSDGQSLKACVENTHQSGAITLLSWDTPLDKSCFKTGVVTMVDIANGKLVQGPEAKINRLLPPTQEDLIEIPAKRNVSQDLKLNEPWMPTDGKTVKITARGRWRAVWPKAKSEVTAEDLAAMDGPGVMEGSFFSEINVKLKSKPQR